MSELENSPEIAEVSFRTLIDEAPVMIWLSDDAIDRQLFNRAWVEFTGLDEKDLKGRGWLQVVHVDDREPLLKALQASNETNEPYVVEYRARRYDGELRWVGERGGPRSSTGFAGSTADITNSREERDQLATRERRFRALVEYSDDIIWLVDEDGMIRYCTPSMVRATGLSEMPLAIDDPQFMHPDDAQRFRDWYGGITKFSSVIRGIRARFRHPEEGWRVYEATFVNSLKDPAVGGVVVTLRNVTNELQSAETIQRLKQALSSIKDEERRELAMALHDDTIQSILAAQWTLDSLNDVVESGSAASIQLAAISNALEAAADSAREVISDLRTPDFNETSLIEELYSVVDTHLKAGGPPIELSGFDDVLFTPAQARVIYRFIREGLINVRKHAEASAVDVFCEIGDVATIVRIVDDGNGIEEVTLWEKAAQGHLGLVSLREQAEGLGGSVRLSGTSSGAVLELVIPR